MRRIAALVIAGALGVAGTVALAGPVGAGAPGPFPADAQIKLKGITGFVGDGIFDSEVGQTLATFASPAQKAVFVVRAQNEKFKKNRIATWIRYADCDNGPGEIKFFHDGQDVTQLMDNDALVVGGIPAGGHFDVRLKMKVAPGAACEVVVGVASDKFPGDADYVYAQVFSTQPGGVL